MESNFHEHIFQMGEKNTPTIDRYISVFQSFFKKITFAPAVLHLGRLRHPEGFLGQERR